MEDEVKSWLDKVFEKNIKDFSVEILANSAKGDGYMGDIVFVSLIPISGNTSKEYNLVLKCSKRSDILRKTTPVKEAFLNEMYVYDTVFPAFTQFQLEKKVEPFSSMPKCYGTLTTENMEIIVLNNLKKNGYDLWGKEKPWTRKHIDLVISQYAKFHSVSIAMKDQQPTKLEELCSGFQDIFKEFIEKTDLQSLFGNRVDEIANLLQGDLDDSVIKIWRKLEDQARFILGEMGQETRVKTILHGDCWGNNFMFKHDEEDQNLPLQVAVLDWQIARYASPILDLSYFLFAGISEEEIENIDDILENYYNSLKTCTEHLGSDLDCIYPKNEFLSDWKKYCKFGLLMASLTLKICTTDKKDVIDIADAAENGGDFGTAFTYEVKDKRAFKNRTRHIVKYAVDKKLIV